MHTSDRQQCRNVPARTAVEIEGSCLHLAGRSRFQHSDRPTKLEAKLKSTSTVDHHLTVWQLCIRRRATFHSNIKHGCNPRRTKRMSQTDVPEFKTISCTRASLSSTRCRQTQHRHRRLDRPSNRSTAYRAPGPQQYW